MFYFKVWLSSFQRYVCDAQLPPKELHTCLMSCLCRLWWNGNKIQIYNIQLPTNGMAFKVRSALLELLRNGLANILHIWCKESCFHLEQIMAVKWLSFHCNLTSFLAPYMLSLKEIGINIYDRLYYDIKIWASSHFLL